MSHCHLRQNFPALRVVFRRCLKARREHTLGIPTLACSTMRNVRRCQMPGYPVFITQVCADRCDALASDARKWLLLQTLAQVRKELDIALYAYVILDDHFHLLLGCADCRFSRLMYSLKRRITNQLRRESCIGLQQLIWQQRFYDHIIRNERDWRAHLDYVHFNPVRHGYTLRAVDYPWSSLGKFVRQGFYPARWGIRGTPQTILGDTGSE